MAQETLTHKDLAAAVGVSVTTIKSYRRKFGEFIPVASRGKPIRFESSALDVVRRIRGCFERDLSVDEVRSELTTEFNVVSTDKQLSSPIVTAPLKHEAGQPASGLMDGREVGESIEALRRAQRDADQRMEAMARVLDELLTLQGRSHQMQAEILARLDTLAQAGARRGGQAEPRRIRVRPAVAETRDRDAGAGAASGGAAASVRPPVDFLEQPVVIRNERGEFLGITSQGKTFSLRDLAEYLLVREQLSPDTGVWTRQGQAYSLGFGEAEGRHELRFERATTPRGNKVVILSRMSLGGEEVSENFLRAFYKRVKDTVS